MPGRGRYGVLAVLLVTVSCARHRPPLTAVPPPPPVPVGAYVDLEPGWRVRVITPLLRSGRFLLAASEVAGDGANLTIRSTDEVLGIETADYAVTAAGRGVAVRLAAVAPSPRPVYPLFAFAPRLRHLRLVYLERGEDASHAMAIVAADRPAALEAPTAAARRGECATARHTACAWVPAGIAVRPERPAGADWKPVR